MATTTQQQPQPQEEPRLSPEDIQDQAAAQADQGDGEAQPAQPVHEPHMDRGKGRAARRKKARARSEGLPQDGDQDADTDSGQDAAGGQEADAGQRQDSKPQDLPAVDLGGGSEENMLSNLTGSAGAGLLGLDPADLDGGGSDVEEEPRPQVFIDEGPRPHRTRTRTAAPDDPEVHESARRLGQRSAEVRHRRRLAAPKIPTLAPPKPEPVRPPPGFDPPRLPGQRRRR